MTGRPSPRTGIFVGFLLTFALLFTTFAEAGGPFSRWNSRQQPAADLSPEIETLKDINRRLDNLIAKDVKTQQVDLTEAPEDGDRPWRIVFTSESWQQSELESLAVYTLEHIGDQEGKVRPQHITPQNPLFQQYQSVHHNDLPCIAVLVPDPNGDIADIPVNIHGSTMALTPEGIYQQIVFSNDPDDIKGRIGNPHSRPFWLPGNRFRHRNGFCPVCQGWHPNRPVQPQQPAPPPRITRLPRIGDTVTGKRLDKLEEMGKEVKELLKKLKEPAKKIVKEVAKEAVKEAMSPLIPAAAMGGMGFLGVLASVIGGARKRVTGFLEEQDEEG